MEKTRKFLGAVSEKTALPTNLLPTTPTLWDLTDADPKIHSDKKYYNKHLKNTSIGFNHV